MQYYSSIVVTKITEIGSDPFMDIVQTSNTERWKYNRVSRSSAKKEFTEALTSVLFNYIGHNGHSARLILHHAPMSVPLDQFHDLFDLRLCSLQAPGGILFHIFLRVGELTMGPGVQDTGLLFHLVRSPH